MKFYNPPEDIIMIRSTKKNFERMIYPFEGPYTEYEEEKYQELLNYYEDQEEEVPHEINKRRAMRFLNGNNYNIKKSFK